MLSAQLKYYDFVARVRNYDDALSFALVPDAIPPAFYPRLIKRVTDHLDVFHRYLRLRKKLLNIKGDQYYYDIYPLGVSQSTKSYSYAQARKIIPTALKPLGKDYLAKLNSALCKGSGWIDVYPNKGKRSGAYSSSVYGHHPLILLNYTDDFDSLSTTAHELGHGLHSAFSNAAQPYPKADYALFVAEVASIFNETLLIEYLLKKEKNPEQRKFLLSAYLDSFRGTVFRQTMFAEFEREAYLRLSARKPLTAESLSRLYLKLLRKYHGHKDGIMNIEPLYGVEWAYIPHFYYHFYVYQYVSGFIAATALAQKVLTNGRGAARKYIENLLKAGSSKDPLDILKEAGVDMMSPEPYALAAKKFAQRVAELEQLQ
jgi:oligoendopeptidase F